MLKNLFTQILLFTLCISYAQALSEDVKLTLNTPQKTNKYITSLLSKRMLIGFLNIKDYSSLVKTDIQKVKNDGYNAIILSNAYVFGSKVILFRNNNSISEPNILDKIYQVKDLGMKVLVSFGGFNNTFHPDTEKNDQDPEVLGKNLTTSQIDELANNILFFLRKYNIDGITLSLRKYTSPELIDKLCSRIKQINPNTIISIDAEINNYKLITHGRSHDYDKAIQNGNIDYIFLREYNSFKQYDPFFISQSYQKIINNTKIPLKTKIVIDEPTSAINANANSIYHPEGNATKSLTTKQAVDLILFQLEFLKFKPRFAGVAGQTLNTDYAANYYGSYDHIPGSFAQGLRDCVYKNICNSENNEIKGPIAAGFLSSWGKGSYNSLDQDIDLKMPSDREYCDKYPNICKYNVIIAGYLIHKGGDEFELSLEGVDSNQKDASEQLKTFINYMRLKGKHVLVSVESNESKINWETVNLDSLKKTVEDYDFDGINFDLSESSIPKNKEISSLAAEKINNFTASIKQEKPNFWLTFSPEWNYIVAPLSKNGKDNIYANHNYIELLNNVGVYNIDYIFLNTYLDNPEGSILSFYKDTNNKYLPVSFLEGYDKFIASLAWALTTKAGYNANKSFNVPADKLVFMIPSSENALNKYIGTPTKRDIDQAVALIKKHKGSLGGFAIWGVDSDEGESDTSSILDTIVDIKLPKAMSYISDKINKKVTKKEEFDLYESVDPSVVNYPNNIGMYDENTIVMYQGKKYRCISNLELELCNDEKYIPDGSLGYLAWNKLNYIEKKKIAVETKLTKTIRYPENIGSYKSNQKVMYNSSKFECIKGKQQLCNNLKYTPTGKMGDLAWADISRELEGSSTIETQDNQLKEKASYIYPENIQYYKGGTLVSVDNTLYRCKMGPESVLCSNKAYMPTGKYGKDAWIKSESYSYS